MKALVLAAGKGVRMGPLTENRPKPMLPVAGKPFLEHTVNALKEAGIDHIVILTGYHGGVIKDHFGDGSKWGVKIDYLVQPERLGTANAVGMAREMMTEDFLCLNGDVIVTHSLVASMIENFGKYGRSLMSLIEVEDVSRYGMVKVKGDIVEAIVEKPRDRARGLINGGIYLFKRNIFEAIERTPLSSRGEYEITHSLQLIMEKEEVGCMVPDAEWVDIGSPWDLLRAHEIYMEGLKEDIRGEVEPNVQIRGRVVLMEGALIRSGTYIEGNVIIDEGAVVGPNSYIRGSTYIGRNSRVGAASEVKNSIILNDTNIPHHNYVGDSIIGSDCNLGSGTKVANLRLDHGPIPVVIKGEKVSSGRRKLGVIMGDDVQTGINATIDPGTMLFSGTRVGPGAKVSGTVGKGSKVH
ncbi:MAG: NTP transferase domain-containing protein [Thermoplasmata archaeon]|nr:NTP transferase domain-containing protein [Thermoplasmata archaeon]